MRKQLVLWIFCCVCVAKSYAQQRIMVGKWDGYIEINKYHLIIKTGFFPQADSVKGIISIPQQGAVNLPLSHVKFVADSVFYTLETAVNKAEFKGAWVSDTMVSGVFIQGVASMPCSMSLVRDNRAQLPYHVEDVSFQNGKIKLAGTLTCPKVGGPFPTLVLLTGSGAQNRDEEVLDFKPFAIIADSLTRRGFAVLRYDDRGVDGSTGDQCEGTTADFAADALSAIKYLQQRKDIDTNRIGLLGHSEGGLIATIAAAKTHAVKFMVMMAGPSLSGEKILKLQMEVIGKANKQPEKEMQEQLSKQAELIAAVKGQKTWTEIEKSTMDLAKQQLKSLPQYANMSDTELDKMAKQVVEAQLKSMQCPWFNFFVKYDPAADLSKIQVPVLALYGSLDTQVPQKQNEQALKSAMTAESKKKLTVKTFAETNHLFVKAKTGSPTEYVGLKKEFIPELLPTIEKWLKANVTK